ncbi:cadmium-inducible lysosomal protein CDR-5 [Aphelenchoides avenae]|nr:cadmium-inducible lysosomal protein CDR-5 [Aphelenchus avenae]
MSATLLNGALAQLEDASPDEIIQNTLSEIAYPWYADYVKSELYRTILRVAIPSVAACVVGKYVYTLLTCKKTRPRKVRIHKKDWKKDVVYLYTFPRPKCTANALPYSLKVETFLRVNNIPYEIVETYLGRSAEGKLPFVEFNGEHYADSQLIIFKLEEYFRPEAGLSPEEHGIVRLVTRMLDTPTFTTIMYHRAGLNCTNFMYAVLEKTVWRHFRHLFFLVAYPYVWKMLNFNGDGRHTEEEIVTILRYDLKALDVILGDKQWFVGGRPTLADCTFFGHIASSYNLPYALPIQRMLEREFPRLKALHDRICRQFFPDVRFHRLPLAIDRL